jgi:hypothetical protein
MARYCRVCGRSIEGDDDFCEACKESIRAEALGKQKKIAKEAPTERGKSGKRDTREGIKENESPSSSRHEEAQKKPHHFKSMAEYLEYLKKEG